MVEIFIDCETIPTQRADIQARCVAGIGPPGQYKKPESIAHWWASEGEEKKAEAIHATCLNGTWGEVVCIGFAINDEPVEVISQIGSECTLLQNFATLLDKQAERGARSNTWPIVATWVGHNIADFDLRFLWQRCKLLGIHMPFQFPLERYSRRVYDTMREWCAFGNRVSQSDLELAFGIPRTDPLKKGGADVWRAYQEGRIDDIREHCRVDVENVRAIYRRMTA